MARVKHAVSTRKRKKRVLKTAKGQFGHKSRRFAQALRSVVKGMVYAYRDRKAKKREFRNLWLVRISAACKQEGISYSRFINGLNIANVEINRKMLAELAVNSPAAFRQLVKTAQEKLPAIPAKKA